jgi:hypothetical protein
MSGRSRILAAFGATVLCTLAQAQAQSFEPLTKVCSPTLVQPLSTAKNEAGLTVGDVFDHQMWAAVTRPLLLETLRAISGNMHRAPRPGVQFELLTPGYAGITIHLRW